MFGYRCFKCSGGKGAEQRQRFRVRNVGFGCDVS